MARPLSLSLFVKSLACLSGFQGINAAVCALRATSPFCDTASRDQRLFLLRLDADLIAEVARMSEVFLPERGEFLGPHEPRLGAEGGEAFAHFGERGDARDLLRHTGAAPAARAVGRGP